MEDFPRSVGFHPASRRVLRFAGFRADLVDMSLWRDGEEVKLPPRALAVLFYLLERPGRVVAKGALLDAVWKDAHVSESSLVEAVGILRQTLGDHAENRIIQTVHRRGYRFVAAVTVEAPASELELVRAAPAPASLPARTSSGPALTGRWRPRPRLIAVAALVVAVIGAWLWSWRQDERAGVSRVTITLPPEMSPAPALSAHPVVALSPDGRRLVYVAGSTGRYRLYSRRLDEFTAQPIPGTENGHGPFFSPDGQHIAFFADGRLLRTALDGGEPLVLTDGAGAGLGGTWTPDGRIVFGRGTFDGLWEVSAGGGTPRLLAAPPDAASGYRWPHATPSGDLIATRWRATPGDSAVVHISPTAVTELVAPASYGRVLNGRTLVFVRAGALMAARISGARIEPPRPALDGVMVGATGAAQFATSDAGDLLYIPDDPERTQRTIVHADRRGTLTPSALPARRYRNLAVCGDLVAATILDDTGASDLWLGDLRRGTLTRLTGGGTNVEPVWRPGCRRIVFGSNRGGVVNMYEIGTNGEDIGRLRDSERNQVPASLTPDGRRLYFVDVAQATRGDLWSIDDEGRVTAVLNTPASESAARVTPDARWLVYQVDDRGPSEVFVTSAGAPASRVPVSRGNARAPVWAPGGRYVYYRHGPEIVEVEVTGTEAPVPGDPRVVLSHPDLALFTATADGLLVVLRGQEHLPLTRLLLVLNWRTELLRRLDDRQ
jgi:DNA-binding winged helix-turn-helix (wHTH) protein/Tol biopolymer transport system component